eukprot:gene2576-5027_t
MRSDYTTITSQPSGSRKSSASYLFKFLLLANICMYLEAGAVPALLLEIANSFGMTSGQQGLLGGIVYLSLGFAGTFCGYLLRHYDHRTVIGSSIGINNIFTLAWALTPVNYSFSTTLFITIRFFMGLTQCALCVFLPLWTNEFAPNEQRTSWMSYLQASVPIGVMLGYVISSVVISFSDGSSVCSGLLCWRWPILIEVILVLPFCIAIHFVPREHVSIRVRHKLSLNKANRLRRQNSREFFSNDPEDQFHPSLPRHNHNYDNNNNMDIDMDIPLTPYQESKNDIGCSLELNEWNNGFHQSSQGHLCAARSNGHNNNNTTNDDNNHNVNPTTPRRLGSHSQFQSQSQSQSQFSPFSPITMSPFSVSGQEDYVDQNLDGNSKGDISSNNNNKNNNHNNNNQQLELYTSFDIIPSILSPPSPPTQQINSNKIIPHTEPKKSTYNRSEMNFQHQYQQPHDHNHYQQQRNSFQNTIESEADRRLLRRNSVRASLFNLLATRDMIRKSTDNLQGLDDLTLVDGDDEEVVLIEETTPINIRHSRWSSGNIMDMRFTSSTTPSADKNNEKRRKSNVIRRDRDRDQVTVDSDYLKKTAAWRGFGTGSTKMTSSNSTVRDSESHQNDNDQQQQHWLADHRYHQHQHHGDDCDYNGNGNESKGYDKNSSALGNDETVILSRGDINGNGEGNGGGGGEGTARCLSVRTSPPSGAHNQHHNNHNNSNSNSNNVSCAAYESLRDVAEASNYGLSPAEAARKRARKRRQKQVKTMHHQSVSIPTESTTSDSSAASGSIVPQSDSHSDYNGNNNIPIIINNMGSTSDGSCSNPNTEQEIKQKDTMSMSMSMSASESSSSSMHKKPTNQKQTIRSRASSKENIDQNKHNGTSTGTATSISTKLKKSTSSNKLHNKNTPLTANSSSIAHPIATTSTATLDRVHIREGSVSMPNILITRGKPTATAVNFKSPVCLLSSGTDTDTSTDYFSGGRSLVPVLSENSPHERLSSSSSYLKKVNNKSSAATPLVELLSTPVYISLVLAMAALYFVVTGVQFWGTSYMALVLDAPMPLVHTTFVICAASGPTLGVFFGGWLVDRFGGYAGIKQRVISLRICFILGLFACGMATGVSLVRSLAVFVPLLWLVLFFGGSILPACSGMLVSVIPRRHRPISASISIVIFNIFGYCLSLVLSGYVMQAAGRFYTPCDSVCARICGFRLVLLWSYWSLLFLGIALYSSITEISRRKNKRLLQRNKNEIGDEGSLPQESSGYTIGEGISLDTVKSRRNKLKMLGKEKILTKILIYLKNESNLIASIALKNSLSSNHSDFIGK